MMTLIPTGRARPRLAAAAAAAVAAAALLLGTSAASAMPLATPAAAASQACDIYASGGTPCVAAFSTTRALYATYSGSLYQVKRSSDNSTLNIGLLSPGGYVNAAAQDSFCAGTSCVITVIYDQSGRGNNLTPAPAGGYVPTPDSPANATAAPIKLNGHEAYGVYTSTGIGYRNDSTSGIATGDNPEGMYDVVDGTHFDGGCCFDFGNAETNNDAGPDGSMEAIYFGNAPYWDTGAGNGPWIMADMEDGLFSGSNVNSKNSGDPTIGYRYTTAMIEGESNQWAIMGGNAQSGGLSTFFSGPRPPGYNPMKKEGAIILGIGGDNSDSGAGTFYEGVMTSGYPSAATESAVQANIVAAGYGSNSTSGNTVTVAGPGNQSGAVGTPISSLQIQASDSAAGQTLTYSASGLPPGLSISSSGLITGTPSSGGIYNPTVTATDTTGATGFASFTWTISGGGGGSTGPLHAVGAGKCLDDPNSTTTGGTQQQIWDCNGQANQSWTHTSSGQLQVTVGGQTLCLDANGQGTTNGTKAIIWTCNGQSNQQWNLNSNGTITGAQSGLCLDVTGASTADGALVELWQCNGGSNQQWTLG